MESGSRALRLLLVLLLFATRAFADGHHVEGQLFERGTKKPMAAVNVYLLPLQLKAVTDAEGKFVFDGIPTGDVEWVINIAGYKTLRQPDVIYENNDEPHKLYVEKSAYETFETTVYGENEKQDDAVKTMTKEEAETVPGTGGDPVRGIQNLPGIARSTFGTQVIIEGSAPSDTSFLLDGHEVPLTFHILGNSSIMQPEAIDHVDYFSAGYAADYGRAQGGLIGIWSAAPETDRIHGMAYVDLYNAGILVQGPIDKDSSIMIGVRRSYLNFLIDLSQQGNSDFTLAPNFEDLSLTYDNQITPIDHFRLLTVGSVDTLSFVSNNPTQADQAARGTYDFNQSFFRIIPELTHKHGENTVSHFSIGLGREWQKYDESATNERYYEVDDSIGLRADLEQKFFGFWNSTLGIDQEYVHSHTELNAQEAGPEYAGQPILRDNDMWGFYWTNAVRIPGTPWTLLPGIRADLFSDTGESLVAPREAIRYELNDTQNIHLAGGIYYQPPPTYETDPNTGNPNLQSPRTWQLALGTDKDFRSLGPWAPLVTFGGFYRFFDRQIVPTNNYTNRGDGPVPEVYDNSGRGRAYGLESLIKLENYPYRIWLAYTLSRSTRWDEANPPALFQYDQTHNVNLIAQAILPRHWEVGIRFRYVTGDPYTPVTGGIFDADTGGYDPITGPLFSTRFNSFLELDLRIDKQWIYDTSIFHLYLDILNVTNRQNPEFIVYSYDYSQSGTASGIPFLPTLGVKVEL